jgi:apolipoprotein N-acyltransferase
VRRHRLSGGPPDRGLARGLTAVAAIVASALAFALCARFDPRFVDLLWIALVPWLAVVDRSPSLVAALGVGVLMSVAFLLAVFWWFIAAIQTYTGAPWIVALVVVVAFAPILEPQFACAAVTRRLVRTRTGRWWAAIAGALVWVGSEWAIPKLFADTLGHGLYASAWMRQAADLGGAPGLTFVVLLGNECVLALVVERRVAAGAAALALPAALLVYGATRSAVLAHAPTRGEPLTVAVIQADIDRYDRLRAERGTYDAVRFILDTHFALSTDAARRAHLDFVVWPETVYPTTFGSPKSEAGADLDREIAAFATNAGLPLVFGSYDADGGAEYNAAVFLAPSRDGRVEFETYRKAALFPLTERVPAVFESPLVRRWLPWLGTWKPGAGVAVVPLGLRDGRTIRVAPLICYDAVDPRLALGAVRRGADLIITLSNDSWFATGNGPHLHLIMSAFRSIETRRPQVRATNTGISAIITPTGDVVAAAGVHAREALVAMVPPAPDVRTLAVAWGDWFGPTALVAGLALVAIALPRGVKTS